MKVLLYGGTFDPPHNGHMNNLQAALERVQPDRAIVMPAGIPPHKAASSTPGAVRLAMCQCFTALSPAVEVSDWEIRQGGAQLYGPYAGNAAGPLPRGAAVSERGQ